jgi:hypothetical protein
MKLNEQVLERAAFEMWRTWAKISDPDWAEKRWNKMNPVARLRFLEEARVAITTYASLC